MNLLFIVMAPKYQMATILRSNGIWCTVDQIRHRSAATCLAPQSRQDLDRCSLQAKSEEEDASCSSANISNEKRNKGSKKKQKKLKADGLAAAFAALDLEPEHNEDSAAASKAQDQMDVKIANGELLAKALTFF